MTEHARYACTIVRAPNAPPRRAGLVWPVGETDAVLTAAEMVLIDADPGYAVALSDTHVSDAPALPADATDGVAVSGSPAQGVPAPTLARPRQRKARS
jgi:hypothetical protein